jgi:hypothetical protein
VHQVQLAITQMFDGITQVLGEDMPLRRVFGLRLCGAWFVGGAEGSRTVSLENRSGVVSSVGSRPIASLCSMSMDNCTHFSFSDLPPNIGHGEGPLSNSQSVRNLPIQRHHFRKWYLLRIGQFNTIGRAKICGEIYNAIALRSRE